MENSINILEKEIRRIQAIIKKAMLSKGDFDRKLELLIGEHYTAIAKLEGMARITFYDLKEPFTKNKLIEVGGRYPSLNKDQGITHNDLIFLHNWGIVEKSRVEKVTDICSECGMPNKGKGAKDKPNGCGWYICLCDWDMSNVTNYNCNHHEEEQCQN